MVVQKMVNSKITSTRSHSFINSTVISKDGTTIGYKSIGHGPSVLIIHGALSDSDDFTMLAQELSDSFTVHILDRRGRGMSGPQGMEYSIKKECEDVEVVQEATKARYLIGHSFGGLVSLEFARLNQSFTKIALYEPGVTLSPENGDWLIKYEKAIEKKDDREAFTHFVRGAGHTPLTNLPLWYAKFILRVMVRGKNWDKKEKLLAENLNEHKEVYRLRDTYENYKNISADVLLISGGKSPQSVTKTIHVLDQTIEKTQTKTFDQLDHFGPDNTGSPTEVAPHIKNFFLH